MKELEMWKRNIDGKIFDTFPTFEKCASNLT
jgi:hypothetical protein